MSTRRGQHKEEENSDTLPVLGEDGRGSAGGYYNNNHVRNKPTSYRAFPSGSRPGSGSRRTPTPTKQIALQAVRRKDDVVKEPFDDVDLEELNSTLKLESEKSFLERENSNTDLKKGDGASGFTVKLPNGYGSGARPKDSPSKTSHHSDTDSWDNEIARSVPNSKSLQKTQNSKSSKVKGSGKTEDSSDDDDDDEDDDDQASWQEGDNKTAPMQLMMEFIGCLMQGDYLNAAKLCKMILMYEPTNAEALKFQPLINEKIDLDAQPDVDSGSGGSGSEDDDATDEGNSDDDSDSDDSDDDSDSSDNSSSEAENEGEKPDSGISSGLSRSNSNSEME
ncbi:dentin sialophosphoprotein-like [Mizuhopecten yessoensis]|uniref:Glutamate-rich protein 2 n=1 Tax=Mizuhopecten yessoensis TaxID=6573 RepID=A0A210QIY6_MIZYE|nr:dentin sialophosphoprotein-like [Mizuhopecten yessoensis]OWF48707.1 Glutamate-rich protein 2 [Mizuhopecten yessoensis]